jgi:hypothetical protein
VCRRQERFTLGVYSSATVRTVTSAVGQIETAVGAGGDTPLFQHVLERRHCSAAPEEVRTQGTLTLTLTLTLPLTLTLTLTIAPTLCF